MVCFVPEKTCSASNDIAGIENISSAIVDKTGNRMRCAVSIHHEITGPVCINRGSETYCCSSSTFLRRCAYFWAIQERYALFEVVGSFVSGTLCTVPVDDR